MYGVEKGITSLRENQIRSPHSDSYNLHFQVGINRRVITWYNREWQGVWQFDGSYVENGRTS